MKISDQEKQWRRDVIEYHDWIMKPIRERQRRAFLKKRKIPTCVIEFESALNKSGFKSGIPKEKYEQRNSGKNGET